MREFIISFDTDKPLSELVSGETVRALMKTTGDCDEVIRCKDCKYYTGKWCTRYSTKQFDMNDICKDDDDFCSGAERKEENEH